MKDDQHCSNKRNANWNYLEIPFPTYQIGKNPKVWQQPQLFYVADGNAKWYNPCAREFGKSQQNCWYSQPATWESHCWKSAPAGTLKDVSTRLFIATWLVIAKDREQGACSSVGTMVSSTVEDSVCKGEWGTSQQIAAGEITEGGCTMHEARWRKVRSYVNIYLRKKWSNTSIYAYIYMYM